MQRSAPGARGRRWFALPPALCLIALLVGACWKSATTGAPTFRESAPIAAPTITPARAAPRPPLAETEDRPSPSHFLSAPRELEAGSFLIRVGLVTDREEVTVPAGRVLVQGNRRLSVDQTSVVRPDARVRAHPVWRLQVAALKDEGQATRLAADLAERTSEPAEATFDASSDLYRVRWGRFSSRQGALDTLGSLAAHGITSGWAVSEGEALSGAALELVSGNRRVRLPGRVLEIEGTDASFDLEGQRHRGALQVYLNDRGLLNLIADVPLEEYLRGVVPREMGPALYPEPEALKAQAVAARTFTLLNLGAFDHEGYDLCSTPRCQVYGGMSVEHPLSDRAIRETAGQVLLLAGRPAETLYSATCGGHTEDVSTVFPEKSSPHLRGIPCLEHGTIRMTGAPGGVTSEEDVRAFLSRSHSSADLPEPMTRRVAFVGWEDGVLRVHEGRNPVDVPRHPEFRTYGPDGSPRPLELAPGDPLDLVIVEGRALALVQARELRPVSLARHASRQRWTRTRSHEEVRRIVQKQYPGFPFSDFEVLERGISGRIGRLELIGDGMERIQVQGLAVRWTFDLPDTDFEWVRTPSETGPPGWFFRGTGWGHGVGLCQIGSFGMARRGLTYREILHHYYGGVEFGSIRSRRWRQSSSRRIDPATVE